MAEFKEFPKTLHGTVKGEPVSKIVKDAEDEKAARKAGWGDVPKQDHGPTAEELDKAAAAPVKLDPPAKTAAKPTPKKK